MKPFSIALLVLSVIFFSFNFINYNTHIDYKEGTIIEAFDSTLIRLNTLEKFTNYVDSVSAIKNIEQGSLEYAIEANNIVQNRFYHGYSTFSSNENWIAVVLEKFSPVFFSARVKPDDILKKTYGFCNQQSIVLMELLQSKKLDCRPVKFPDHFTIQCRINGKWNYFDPDLEPKILPEQRSNEEWLINSDSLALAYKDVIAFKEKYNNRTDVIDSTFGKPIIPVYGEINAVQAPNTRLFQKVSKPLSKIAFIFPLLLFFYINRKRVKSKKTVEQFG